MRDFAWASVKLFAPAAGAPGLFALGLATAGVLALGFAEGAMVCANAPPAPTRTVMTAVAKSCFIDDFLNLSRYRRDQQVSAGLVP